MARRKFSWRVVKKYGRMMVDAGKDWSSDDAASLAAALAYYAIFSLAPLLVIMAAVVGVVYGEEAAHGAIASQLAQYVGAESAKVIQDAVQQSGKESSGGLIASIASAGLLLFGASKVFLQLQEALNRVWEVTASRDSGIKQLVIKRFVSLGMILGLCFLLLISLVVSTVIGALSTHLSTMLPGADYIWSFVNLMITAVVYVLLFGLLFKYVPDVDITWRSVWFGAIVTTILFMLGQWALSYYLAMNSDLTAFGAAGAILSMLVWIYYSAQIVFYGAEITQQWARQHGDSIKPSDHAEWRPGATRGLSGVKI